MDEVWTDFFFIGTLLQALAWILTTGRSRDGQAMARQRGMGARTISVYTRRAIDRDPGNNNGERVGRWWGSMSRGRRAVRGRHWQTAVAEAAAGAGGQGRTEDSWDERKCYLFVCRCWRVDRPARTRTTSTSIGSVWRPTASHVVGSSWCLALRRPRRRNTTNTWFDNSNSNNNYNIRIPIAGVIANARYNNIIILCVFDTCILANTTAADGGLPVRLCDGR